MVEVEAVVVVVVVVALVAIVATAVTGRLSSGAGNRVSLHMIACQRFLMALSVLPVKKLAIYRMSHGVKNRLSERMRSLT